MKRIWKVLVVAAAASVVPVVICKDPKTGERSINALLWQVRICPDPSTKKQRVTAVSILPNHRCKGRGLPCRKERLYMGGEDILIPNK